MYRPGRLNMSMLLHREVYRGQLVCDAQASGPMLKLGAQLQRFCGGPTGCFLISLVRCLVSTREDSQGWSERR